MKHLLFQLTLSAIAVQSSFADVKFDDVYKTEDIKLPADVPPEVGAIDFAPDGTLFVVLRRGDVFRAKPVADPKAFDWQLFATGFHNGTGIDAVSSSKIRITQMAEMTEAEDTDGDGSADLFTPFATGWGLSGNYHETNTLTSDGKDGYYLAIGTASHNGPTFFHTLGEYSEAGRRGRNFSAVKWRGWVLHADAKGHLTPVASGFRMHNGIYLDPRGNLWAGDNQGDWKATTPLYHIEKGNFYGHPGSLVWDPNFKKSDDPLGYYRDHMDEYNADRTYAAVEIPYNMNRSAGEPIEIPADGSFGPFAGQLLLPDNNGTRLTRLTLEQVNGVWQGAATHFIDGHGLRSGNHRTRFSPDGKQLYIGQTVRGWGLPAEGLQRVTWLGGTPFDVDTLTITPTGFTFTFTRDIPEKLKDVSLWKVSSFTYQSTWQYGGNQEHKMDHEAKITNATANSITLGTGPPEVHRIYRFDLPKSNSADGSKIQNTTFYYTVNTVPK